MSEDLLSELQSTQAQVKLLQRLLHLFGAPDDFDAVFQGLMDAAMDFFHAHAGSLYIFDAEKGELYFAAARGPAAQQLLELDLTIKPGQGIAGSCYQNMEVIALSDAHKDPRFAKEISEKVGYEVRSMLTAPIVCDGQPLGAIQVLNKQGSSAFSQDEVELMRQLGRYAGGLIALGLELDYLHDAAGSHQAEPAETEA
ncbi:GAF domain-containing protein [Planctomycetota bacterium]|nr:GAF domain-containing protein [Planctomycetota bacterium]